MQTAATATRADTATKIPFDIAMLDRLMDEAGIDVMLVTSKHAVQYLMGGHRTFFHDYMDALGASRYLPVLAYAKGAPEKAFYTGHGSEGFQHALNPFWTPEVQTKSTGSIDSMQRAVDHLKKVGIKPRRIGVEMPFIPHDAAVLLQKSFPDAELAEGLKVLERLRARKTPEELKKLRIASDLVTESMMAVIEGYGPGATKQEVADALRREETDRGLLFEYCLITAGTSLNRAPSAQKIEAGDIMSIDSGGNYHGYIGDLCRMAIFGEPDQELKDLLADVDAIQQAAFKAIKPGAPGAGIYESALKVLTSTKAAEHIDFVAHGMGLVSHESPRLTNRTRDPFKPEDARLPLQSRMVLSVETTMHHPRRGFIKLEDTAVVTETGHELYGERGRGWNRGGGKARH